MKKNSKDSKQMLFEMMHKVSGMPLREENNNDPTKDEMLSYLNDRFKGLIDPQDTESNKFDMEQAIYWFAYGYHGGQHSNLYSALSTSQYSPSPLINNIHDTKDELSIMMYDALVDRFGK